MEFLKAILGENLYAQVEQAVTVYNGKPENKDAQVKLGNLGGGEYISKGKYATLEAENQTNASKLTEANNLIQQLQKAAKGDEALQGKVTEYQTKVQQLETELAKTKLESAIKVELLEAKATDVDYLTFKLKEKGELALDESGKIKGWDDKLAALKTQFPAWFAGEGKKIIEPNKLPEGDGGSGSAVTREAFDKMGYNARVEFKRSNPEQYEQFMKG